MGNVTSYTLPDVSIDNIVLGVKAIDRDGNQSIVLYYIEGNNHNGDMMMAYLPKQKVLVEADMFTPPAPGGPALPPVAMGFANTLYDNVQRLKLDIATIAPLHGRVVPYSDFPKAIGK